MENWIFKILGNIELVNEKLFYLLEPYATKIISHIKENTLGSIMLIIIVIIIFRNINKLFKKSIDIFYKNLNSNIEIHK